MRSPALLVAAVLALSAGISVAHDVSSHKEEKSASQPSTGTTNPTEPPSNGGGTKGHHKPKGPKGKNPPGTPAASPGGGEGYKGDGNTNCLVLWMKTEQYATDIVMVPKGKDAAELVRMQNAKYGENAIFNIPDASGRLTTNSTGLSLVSAGGKMFLSSSLPSGAQYVKATPNLGAVGGFTVKDSVPQVCPDGKDDVITFQSAKGGTTNGATDGQCKPAQVTADRAYCQTGVRVDEKAGPPQQPPPQQ